MISDGAEVSRAALLGSPTLKRSAAAGVATIGEAGVEIAQEGLIGTQEAVLPLVPYLDSLRWRFIAVAFAVHTDSH